MKIKNLFLLVAAIYATHTLAQDCTFYFPMDKGQQVVRNCYDAQGTLTNVFTITVENSYDYPSGYEVIADYTYSDASNQTLTSGQMVACCDDENFYLDMKNRIPFTNALNMMDADVLLVSNLMPYPNAFTGTDPFDPDNNVGFTEGDISIYQKHNKDNRARISIRNRQYEKDEEITTPAGTFHCTKVKFDIDLWTPQGKTEGYGYEWYSPKVGVVHSEQYDKNKVLQSYSVLEMQTKN